MTSARHATVSNGKRPIVISSSDEDDNPTTISKKTKLGAAFYDGLTVLESASEYPTPTILTPLVSRVAKNLFRGTVEVAGTLTANRRTEHDTRAIFAGHTWDPETIVWGERIVSGSSYYESVSLDGVRYEVGDVVMLIPGEDEDRQRAATSASTAARSVNKYADSLWFCRICYFFESTNNEKMFHGQWFVHGSKTILQETAHSQSLFLTNKCDDNLVAAIFKKCSFRILSPKEKEPWDSADPDGEGFFCSLMWDQDQAAFTDLPSLEESEVILSSLVEHMPCYACGINAQGLRFQELTPLTHGWSQFGISYHMYDFVYVNTNESNALFGIGQVVGLRITGAEGQETTESASELTEYDQPMVKVRYCQRWEQLARNEDEDEDRQDFGILPETNSANHYQNPYPMLAEQQLCFLPVTEWVTTDSVDGKCFVKRLLPTVNSSRSSTITPHQLEDWCSTQDHFWMCHEQNDNSEVVELVTNLVTCKECLQEHLEDLNRKFAFQQRCTPLRGLELFSGAGGLGTGFEMSGFVRTKWAVEASPSAAKTYQQNHPETVVYCQDTNILLKHAVETHEGKQPPLLPSLHGKQHCPLMPEPGEVDFIYGGPPCQAFSGANHNKKADDVRSILPGNMLSYLEFYDADYLLLENVKGLINFPLMSEQADRCLRGGIKSGVVKFIMRTLITLGYQVHLKLLQAGHYGAPQGRLRVIFWGAKRGLELPKFPIPTHTFPTGVPFITLPTGDKLPPPTRSKKPDEYHQCAPLEGVTIATALGDLPPFDWADPYEIFPATNNNLKLDYHRQSVLKIKSFSAHHPSDAPEGVGFSLPTPYEKQPQNGYQMSMRENSNELVTDHVTRVFKAKLVEATVKVPLKPNACHRDLPPQLQPQCVLTGRQASKAFYGRLGESDHFKTALTLLRPNMKALWPLHPTQRRIYTIRECARAQGFPDHYRFMSVEEKVSAVIESKIRQIGNAVPVQLALALGHCLGNAMMAVEKLAERPVDERDLSPAL